MTLEKLIEAMRKRPRWVGTKARVVIYDYQDEEGGGWRVDVNQTVCKGDTLSDALLAAFHVVIGRGSVRARMCPPSSGLPARRIGYDYRTPDWSPPRRKRVRL